MISTYAHNSALLSQVSAYCHDDYRGHISLLGIARVVFFLICLNFLSRLMGHDDELSEYVMAIIPWPKASGQGKSVPEDDILTCFNRKLDILTGFEKYNRTCSMFPRGL